MHKLHKKHHTILATLHKQPFKLFSGDLFFFQQECSTGFQHVPVLLNDLFRAAIALVYDPFDLRVNLSGNGFAVASCMGQISSNKYFFAVMMS